MKRFLPLICMFLFCLTTLAQKGVKESCRAEIPPKIDGDLGEWQTEWLLDPDGKFIYNVCNDANKLYVRIQMSDSEVQRKVGLFGFTLWLDPSGKKKEKLGLRYPVGAYNQEKDLPQVPKDAKRGELEKALLSDVEGLELIGLADDPIYSSRHGLMNGLEMAITALDDGAYQYEVKIPFKAFRIDRSKVPVLGIGFETGRHDPKIPPQQNRSGASPSSIAAGGRGNGVMGNNMNYAVAMMGTGGYSKWTTPTKMWFAIKLN